MITALIKLEVHACGSCGGVYGLPKEFCKKQRETGNGKGWYCPWCKTAWHYPQEETKLEKQIAETNRYRNFLAVERACHDQTKASLRSHKAAKTRIKNRIAKGICPCCNRYFNNLDHHMKSKHPDYLSEVEHG